MYNRRTKQIHKIIASQLGVGLIMAVIAVSVLFYAQGYRFNIKSFKIIKTGVLSLISDPKGATVYLDGKEQKQKTPFAEGLITGQYEVTIKKDGYEPWTASFKIEPELVTPFKSIVLFKNNSDIKSLTDLKKIALLTAPEDVLAVIKSDNLLVNSDYEIWQNHTLVTRFSSPIHNAIWYPDDEHIIFQQGNEIRVIEKKGYNDTLLVRLSSDNPERFITNQNGDELYYTDKGEYKVATIR